MSDNSLTVSEGNFLAPAAGLRHVLEAYQAKKEFIEQVLREKVDFGTIPGSDKPALLKPGAEKLSSFFGLAPVFEDIKTIEDWTGEDHSGEPFFYYRQRVKLYRGDRLIATAEGSCNSWEKKYRYRNADRTCPKCGKATIKRSKFAPRGAPAGTEPGWYCYDKLGGCGENFTANAPEITGQQLGQIKNPDIADLANTILKMAQKRTLVAGVLIATNASDYFTQDTDDFIQGDWHDPEPTPAPQPDPPAFDLKAAWKSEKVSYDLASTIKDRNGKRYIDIPLDTLENFMLPALDKHINDPEITPEDKEASELKADTIAAILEAHCRQ